MRFQTDRKSRRIPADLNVTSFVDIIFNLLVFFILSTSFATGATSSGLVVDLPASSSSDKTVEERDLVVAMLREGIIVVRGKQLTVDLVTAEVTAWKKENPAGMVIVQADSEVPHGRVVGVMDQVKAAGVARVVIATQR